MRPTRILPAIAAAAATSGIALLATATPAHAAFMPPGGGAWNVAAANASHCGSGYTLVAERPTTGIVAALYRHGSTYCALTLNASGSRTPTTGITLYVTRHGSQRSVGTDRGHYASYAGPIHYRASHGDTMDADGSMNYPGEGFYADASATA